MKKTILALLTLAVFWVSCKKEIIDSVSNLKQDSTTPIALDDAQKHYYSLKRGNKTISLSNKQSYIYEQKDSFKINRIAILPKWKKAVQSKNKMYSYVEVPINNFRYVFVYSKDNNKYSNEQKRQIFNNIKSFLIIFKDSTGRLKERIISYIPDFAYLTNSNYRIHETTKEIN